MSNITEVFENIINELKSDLGEGFVATDIWHSKDAQSLAGYNSQPKAVALFNEVTRILDKILKGSKYPGLGEYYLVKLENNYIVIIVIAGEFQQVLVVDLSKVTMGLIMSVVVPKLQEQLNQIAVK